MTTQDNRCYQAEGTDDFRIVLDRLEGGWVDYDPGDSGTVYRDARNTQEPWRMRRLTLGPSGEPLSVQAFTDDTGAPLKSDTTIREALAIARTRPAWLLVVTSAGRLLGSTDRGAHWTHVVNPGANETICGVEYSPTDEHHAYCTTGRGEVWHSSGGGGVGTWTRLPRGPLRVYSAFGANDITFGEDVTTLWVGDVDAADGALWRPISGRSPALTLPPRLPITGIAIDPTPPGAIYVSHLLGIHVSTDGGGSWTPFDEGLPNCFEADLDFHAPTRTLHVARMGRGLYRRSLPERP